MLRAALLALVASIVANIANGQVEEPASPPLPQDVAPTPEEVAPLEEEKINQFADAYLAIEQIHATTAAELNKTQDAVAADKVKAQAETQIIEAVEQSGLRLEEFNQIADLMSMDVQLRQKIATRVQQRRKS